MTRSAPRTARIFASLALALASFAPIARGDEAQALESERQQLVARTCRETEPTALRTMMARLEEIDRRLRTLGLEPPPAEPSRSAPSGQAARPRPSAEELEEKRAEVMEALLHGEDERLPALLDPEALEALSVLDKIELLVLVDDPDVVVPVVESLSPAQARTVFDEPGFFARTFGALPPEGRQRLLRAIADKGEAGREIAREGLEDFVRRSAERDAKRQLLARLEAVDQAALFQSRSWAGLVADEVVMRENDARAKRLTEAADQILNIAISSSIGLASAGAASWLSAEAGLAGATKVIVEGVITTSGAGLSFATQQAIQSDPDAAKAYLNELLGSLPIAKEIGSAGPLGVGDVISLAGNVNNVAGSLRKLQQDVLKDTVTRDAEGVGPQVRALLALSPEELRTFANTLPEKVTERLAEVPEADRVFVRNRILRDYWSKAHYELAALRGSLLRDLAELDADLGADPAR